ncbi:MAG: efflux RND transporter periplasmic adaptor subunit [Planctomycetota bacterium]
MPTLLVLAALGGLASWGHRTGWKVPHLSDLAGTEAGEKEDWCAEHNVPDSTCIACHPELAGASPADWCKEHGVPESRCTVCHPEILTRGVAGDWCTEHGVPESACTACHPEIAVKGDVSANDAGAVVLPPLNAATAPAPQPVANHERPDMTAARPLTNRPGKDPKTCQTHARRVQFASAAAVTKAGIHLANVTERAMTATLDVNAETDYDRTHFAQIASPVRGRLWRVEKEVGQVVRKGEVVALVDSAEVGKAKADLLEAAASLELRQRIYERVRASAEVHVRTTAELQEAEAAMQEADIKLFNARQALNNLGLPVPQADLAKLPQKQTIQFLGLSAELLKTFDPDTTTANLIPLVAPFDGVIIERHAVAGEVVEPSESLLVVTDTRRLWVVMDLPLADAHRVSLGQEVVFRPDAERDRSAGGKVTWISTAVEDQTRTLRVRAEVDADGRLPARAWGRAHIVIRQAPSAIAIPSEAIQWEGCCYVAFVRLSDTVFQTRKLRLGVKADGFTEVLVGVLPGEAVVTTGSNVLKSEILKANLGAGCTDD